MFFNRQVYIREADRLTWSSEHSVERNFTLTSTRIPSTSSKAAQLLLFQKTTSHTGNTNQKFFILELQKVPTNLIKAARFLAHAGKHVCDIYVYIFLGSSIFWKKIVIAFPFFILLCPGLIFSLLNLRKLVSLITSHLKTLINPSQNPGKAPSLQISHFSGVCSILQPASSGC